jgi:hypothetical protein
VGEGGCRDRLERQRAELTVTLVACRKRLQMQRDDAGDRVAAVAALRLPRNIGEGRAERPTSPTATPGPRVKQLRRDLME